MFKLLKHSPCLSLYEVLDCRCLCRLYFDCEYLRAFNPARSSLDVQLPGLLLDLTDRVLAASGRKCNRDSLWVLDASSIDKFSQHLVVELSGEHPYVGGVHAVGALVKSVVALASQQLSVVDGADGSLRCIVDHAVYNTNQQFRVIFSSKYGQQRPLLPFNRLQHLQLHSVIGPRSRVLWFLVHGSMLTVIVMLLLLLWVAVHLLQPSAVYILTWSIS